MKKGSGMTKMKKQVITLAAILFLTAGCSSGNSDAEGKQSGQTQSSDTGEVHKLEQTTKRLENVQLFQDGRSFSDGVAWVRYKDRWHLIDTKGKLLLNLEKDEQPSTNFSNGVAIINKNKMINKEGRILCDIKKAGLDQFLVGEDKAGNILGTNSRGYVFARGVRETVDGKVTLLALVDNQGKFAIEPTKKMTLSRYAGDSQFEIGYQNLERVFYNRDINQQYRIKDEKSVMDGLKFNDNYGVGLLDVNQHPYLFDEYGSQKQLQLEHVSVEGITEGFVGIYSNGLFYYRSRQQGQLVQGFYNKEGKQIIDLSQEKIQTEPYPYFNEGHCLLVYPEQQTFTIIDKTGKKMFEPQQGDVTGSEISNGLLRVKKSKDDFSFIDMKGATVLAVKGEEYQTIGDDKKVELDVAAFHDGLLRVKAEGKAFYLDTKGKNLTVDFSQ